MNEEVGEEDHGADASYDGVGAGETSSSPKFAACSIDSGHVEDGEVAETVDDGVTTGAAFAGGAKEFKHDRGEQSVAGTDGPDGAVPSRP